MPALRTRSEDIPLLLRHFLKTLGVEKIGLEDDALRFLESYEWPGNVRELRNLAERIAVMYRGDTIGESAIADLLKKSPAAFGGRRETADSGKNSALKPFFAPGPEILDSNLNTAKESFEKYYLEYQLSRNCGIISKTAEAIGIYPSNLHAKLRKYQITVPKSNKKEEQ
ncbi:MAG: sigma-54-dependent Fis family transcriptional regulator, partial [Treponema sp.]|jgi:two-component system nitrogen regulation response regulator NtrX|nr:sigma-54-dependent Fis family transcriptional regulator [Treponema sp.]